jgi:hypothetical protein
MRSWTQKWELENQTQTIKEDILRRKKEAINNQQSLTKPKGLNHSKVNFKFLTRLDMVPLLDMVPFQVILHALIPSQKKNILLRVFMVNFGEQILMNEWVVNLLMSWIGRNSKLSSMVIESLLKDISENSFEHILTGVFKSIQMSIGIGNCFLMKCMIISFASRDTMANIFVHIKTEHFVVIPKNHTTTRSLK